MKLDDFEHLIPGLVLGNWSSLSQAVKHGHNRVVHYLNTYYSLLNEATPQDLLALANIAAVNGRVDLVQMFVESGMAPARTVLPEVVARGHGQMWEYLINVCGFDQLAPTQMYVCYPHFKHLVTPELLAQFDHVDVIQHLVKYDCIDQLKELYPSPPVLSVHKLMPLAVSNDSLECFKYLLDYVESKGFDVNSRQLQQIVFTRGSHRIMMYYANRYPGTMLSEDQFASYSKYDNILRYGSLKLFDTLVRQGNIKPDGPGLFNILRAGSVDGLKYWHGDYVHMEYMLHRGVAHGLGGGLAMIKHLVQLAEDDDYEQEVLMEGFQELSLPIYNYCIKHKQFATFMYFLKFLQIRLPLDLQNSLQQMARYDKVKVGVKFLDVLKDYLLF